MTDESLKRDEWMKGRRAYKRGTYRMVGEQVESQCQVWVTNISHNVAVLQCHN